MDYLPAFLDIRDRPCLVVGGGPVAAHKAALLVKAGGKVTVVAPALCRALAELGAAGQTRHHARAFKPEDLDGCALAIAATGDRTVNRSVSVRARARGVPVNVVDQPDLCSFIVPSIVDRSPVLVAVSSGGTSPVLARLLRARLESLIPASYGQLALLAQRFRDRVKARFGNVLERRRFWERALQGPAAEMALAGQMTAAQLALELALQRESPAALSQGEVYLVGAGPGDPDLLTFRALRLMQQADVVVYDRLVSPPVLELVRRDAERIYVGKEHRHHAVPQGDINHLLVRLARAGKRVLRLKGGDPFIFGRGGEEIETLAQEGIPFEVVPGITSASGCAAYAGIPLTHRDHAHSCVFVAGHVKDGGDDLDWDALARPRQTVVVYMGLHNVAMICGNLIAHGMPATTPAALIQQGTTPNQRVLAATLTELPDCVERASVKAPTLLVIGEVVRLRERLAWFDPGASVRDEGDGTFGRSLAAGEGRRFAGRSA